MPRSLFFGGALAAAALATASFGCNPTVAVDPFSSTTAGGGEGGQTVTGTVTAAGGAGGAGGETATSSAPGGAGSAASTSSSSAGCLDDGDCQGNAAGPYCYVPTGQCGECLPDNGACPEAICDPATLTCVGCASDADCADPSAPACHPATKVCVACVPGGGYCQAGEVCDADTSWCVPGCDASSACPPGLSCCLGTCFDLAADILHCGACDFVCAGGAFTTVACLNETCVTTGCNESHADCNGLPEDGCEHNTLADGPCLCVPGSSQACYAGAPGTLGVGECHAGTQPCAPGGTGWGPCENQVLPIVEVCANGLDDDCNGSADVVPDLDGDGWSRCEGDCDETNKQVNPGAMEVTYVLVDDDNNPWTPPIYVYGGNGLDDDCDPGTLDTAPPVSCSAAAVTSGVTALDLAHALEICQTAPANPPKAQRTWGLIAAELLRPDGTPPPAAQLADFQNSQTAVLADYGASTPRAGATLIGLSTGRMRDENDAGHVAPSPGTDFGWAGAVPPSYLSAHAGNLPAFNGCNGNCPGGSGANDGVMLRLKLRAPTNMKAFSFDHRFFSGEYPGDVCTGKNDFVLALLTSAVPGLPQDHNVMFDSISNPVSVSNVLFDTCAPSGCFTCPKGSGDLAGTGMPAATSWLTADAPMVPGEVMTLDLTVFDVSGGSGDSVALFDHFRYVWFPDPPPDH